jgi:hypothetical protein
MREEETKTQTYYNATLITTDRGLQYKGMHHKTFLQPWLNSYSSKQYKKRVVVQNKSDLLQEIFLYNTWTLQQNKV